jgi:hypothetical protein
MLFEAANLALNVGSMLSARRKRKAQERQLALQAGIQRRAGQLAENDLFAEANAAYSQQVLGAEREALAEKASDEATRQARLQRDGPDVFLAPVTAAERSASRKAFFDEGSIL